MRLHSKLTGDSAMRGGLTPTVAGEIDRADVHALGQRLVDQVDHELAGLADVVFGILVAAVIARAVDAEHHDRRVGADGVKKAEWRRVDMPLAVNGRR